MLAFHIHYVGFFGNQITSLTSQLFAAWQYWFMNRLKSDSKYISVATKDIDGLLDSSTTFLLAYLNFLRLRGLWSACYLMHPRCLLLSCFVWIDDGCTERGELIGGNQRLVYNRWLSLLPLTLLLFAGVFDLRFKRLAECGIIAVHNSYRGFDKVVFLKSLHSHLFGLLYRWLWLVVDFLLHPPLLLLVF